MSLAKSPNSLALLSLVLFCASPMIEANERTRSVRLMPEKNSQNVEVKLALHNVKQAGPRLQRSGDVSGDDKLKLGDLVSVCVQASEGGYITLWADSSNTPTMILPNTYSTEIKRALQVDAGREHCVGEGEAAYRFRVDKPTGTQRLIAHWTATLDDAVPVDAYVSLDDGAARSAGGAEVTKTLEYEVVE